jgi:hypothetical protein
MKAKVAKTNDRFVIIMAGRTRRALLARQPPADAQAAHHPAGRNVLPSAGRRSRAAAGADEEHHHHHQRGPGRRGEASNCPSCPRKTSLPNPCGRDTCAAVTLGAALVGARSTTGVMAVLPADHVIPEEKKFQQVLSDAFDLASRGQVIVTIGIKPTEPATGYGYIHMGNQLPTPQGVKRYKRRSTKPSVSSRNPTAKRALDYLNSGQYRWNAGMFVWSFVTITNGLEAHQPEMFAACQRWFKVASSPIQTGQGAGEGISRDSQNIDRLCADGASAERRGGRRRFRVGRPRRLARARASRQGRRRRQLRVGGFRPRRCRAQRHLRRPHEGTRTPIASWACAIPSSSDRRRGAGRAQEPGAENQGAGQRSRRHGQKQTTDFYPS